MTDNTRAGERCPTCRGCGCGEGGKPECYDGKCSLWRKLGKERGCKPCPTCKGSGYTTPTPREDTRLLSAEAARGSAAFSDERMTDQRLAEIRLWIHRAKKAGEAWLPAEYLYDELVAERGRNAALLAKPEVSENVEEAQVRRIEGYCELAEGVCDIHDEVPTLRDKVARLEGELLAADDVISDVHVAQVDCATAQARIRRYWELRANNGGDHHV